jgi:hypothetical protein
MSDDYYDEIIKNVEINDDYKSKFKSYLNTNIEVKEFIFFQKMTITNLML